MIESGGQIRKYIDTIMAQNISSKDDMDFDYDTQASPPQSYQNSAPEVTEVGGSSATSPSNSSVNDYYEDIPISRLTKIFAMCASLNSCNLGYDIGVNTSAGILLQDENSLALSDGKMGVFMGSLNLFAAVGAFFASTISDRFGRRGGFVAAACSFVVGVLCMSFAQSYTSLMFGRVFVGLGVGFGLSVDPIYISELSPPKYRGYLVTWSEIATNVGIVLGFSSGLLFEDVEADTAWRLMFGMGCILPVVLVLLVIFVMPESPRWLVKEGKLHEARKVLASIYPQGYNVSKVVEEIQHAISREEEAEHAVGWDIIFFPSPAFKRMLFVGIGSAVAQQLVGIDAIQYFLDYIIKEAGIESRSNRLLILVVLGILKMGVIVLAGKLFDTKGRRILMFTSLIGKSLSLLLLIYVEKISFSPFWYWILYTT